MNIICGSYLKFVLNYEYYVSECLFTKSRLDMFVSQTFLRKPACPAKKRSALIKNRVVPTWNSHQLIQRQAVKLALKLVQNRFRLRITKFLLFSNIMFDQTLIISLFTHYEALNILTRLMIYMQRLIYKPCLSKPVCKLMSMWAWEFMRMPIRPTA